VRAPPEVVDLREYDFDVAAAMATGAMDRGRVDRAGPCDCLHGASSATHCNTRRRPSSPEVGPRALGYFTTKARTPMPAPVLERVDGLLTSPDPTRTPVGGRNRVPVAMPVVRRASSS
jgi:hypothetical protein